jgi:CheY-like chemotaxis protein
MSKQVLVVDDDPNTVKYLSVMLREHGYEPVAAYDGNEGLEKVKQVPPGLIILDVMMPKRSGFVLLSQLKKDQRYREIPILMLTGVSGVLDEMERHKDELAEKPFDGLREVLRKKIREMREEGLLRPEMFVDKPVEPESFIAKVRELVGG